MIVKESAANEETYVLAVKESDVRFSYAKSGRLSQIRLSANKIIELRENGLLAPEKVQNYSCLMLIHDKKQLPIPIVKGSGRYCGQKGGLLRFLVSSSIQLKKAELSNWHLQLEKGNSE